MVTNLQCAEEGDQGKPEHQSTPIYWGPASDKTVHILLI